jgi:hypothetical protein
MIYLSLRLARVETGRRTVEEKNIFEKIFMRGGTRQYRSSNTL